MSLLAEHRFEAFRQEASYPQADGDPAEPARLCAFIRWGPAADHGEVSLAHGA